jgi:hypothetical protein
MATVSSRGGFDGGRKTANQKDGRDGQHLLS